jgi:hypothetical protein
MCSVGKRDTDGIAIRRARVALVLGCGPSPSAEYADVLHDIVLWLFVVFSGIAAGAGLYEMRVNVPRWFTSASGSAQPVNVDAIMADDSGRRFWAYVTTGPMTLLTVAACVLAWNPATARERWWLAAAFVMLAERLGTLGYFIPTLVKLVQPAPLPAKAAERAARRWVRLNRLRAVFAAAGWLAALRALSL